MTTDYQTSQVTDPVRKTLCDWQIIQDGRQVRPLVRGELEWLLEKHGKSVNLSGADLRGIDLRGMDLRQSILRGCNLEGAIAMPLVTSISGKALPIGDLYYEKALSDWQNTGETSGGMKSVQPTQLDGAILDLANLSHSDFRWTSFDNADMVRSNLQGADLSYANLKEACLSWAKMDDTILRLSSLQGATLMSARIIGTDFSLANLQDVDLTGTFISTVTDFNDAKWDKKYICRAEREGNYKDAEVLYRNLKRWHNRNGDSKIAGEFHYREMEAVRKGEWAEIKKQYRQDHDELKEAWRKFWKFWKRN